MEQVTEPLAVEEIELVAEALAETVAEQPLEHVPAPTTDAQA